MDVNKIGSYLYQFRNHMKIIIKRWVLVLVLIEYLKRIDCFIVTPIEMSSSYLKL